jgi:long-chain acyl-CoA synthetase
MEIALVLRFEPRAVLQTIERRRCTAFLGLPATLQALTREASENHYDVGSLRLCIAGGDTVAVSLQEEFQRCFGVEVREGFGLTEAVPIIVNYPGRARTGSIGEVAIGVEVKIVDEKGEAVSNGVVGEIITRLPGLMVGYWNDPASTAAAIRDGWFYTGDLAYQDEDGYFWFSGRKKEIIIRGGSNVSPQEVEEVLLQHPAVYQAGVVGVPDPKMGESIVAFVSRRDNAACSEQELIDFTKKSLSDHKVPGTVYFLCEMPLGNTGKVSRKALKEMLQGSDPSAGAAGQQL